MENITTQRIIVRRFAPGDLADFLAYQSLPEVRHYMAGDPMNEEGAATFLAAQAAALGSEKERYHAFAVWHRADEKVIGDAGFYLDSGPEAKADLGFQFHPAYHGQCYTLEATQPPPPPWLLAVKFATHHLRLRRPQLRFFSPHGAPGHETRGPLQTKPHHQSNLARRIHLRPVAR